MTLSEYGDELAFWMVNDQRGSKVEIRTRGHRWANTNPPTRMIVAPLVQKKASGGPREVNGTF